MHLIGFYYKNISQCMVFWMSNTSFTFNWNYKQTTMLLYFHMWVHRPQRRVQLICKGYFIYYHFRAIEKKKKSLASQAADRHSLCPVGWQRFGLAMEPTNQDNIYIIIKTHPDYNKNKKYSACLYGFLASKQWWNFQNSVLCCKASDGFLERKL